MFTVLANLRRINVGHAMAALSWRSNVALEMPRALRKASRRPGGSRFCRSSWRMAAFKSLALTDTFKRLASCSFRDSSMSERSTRGASERRDLVVSGRREERMMRFRR